MLTEQLYDISNAKQKFIALLTPKAEEPDTRYGGVLVHYLEHYLVRCLLTPTTQATATH